MTRELTRRAAMGVGLAAATAALTAGPGRAQGAPQAVERWGVFEITLTGVASGNPFDARVKGVFTQGGRTIDAPGFYDGDGIWRVRFSPPSEGAWTWAIVGDVPDLDGRRGGFTVTAPIAGNHGPVAVADTFHFAYADGTPYRQLGTTAYGWTHQEEAQRRRTLETLAASPFNKIRMAIFPKWYVYNRCSPARRADRQRPTGTSPASTPPISSSWISRWRP